MNKYVWIAALVFGAVLLAGSAAFADDLADSDGAVVLEDVSSGDIPKLVELLGDGRPTVRLQAERFLMSFGEDSLDELHGALARRASVREVLVVVRGIADPSSAEPVAGYLFDSDAELASRARGTLQAIGDGAVPVVAELIGDEKVGEAAVGILKGINNPSDDSYTLLREKISKDNPMVVRTRAVSVLGVWKDGYIVENIGELVNDPDADFRASVLEAYDLAAQELDRATLLGLIGDGSSRVRRIAAGMLGRAGDKDDSSVLVGLAAGDPDGMVRAVALNALAEMKGDGAEDALMKGLSDPDPNVVAAALWFVSDYRMVDAVPVIEGMFRSGAPVTAEKQVYDEALLRLAELEENVDLGPFLKFIGPEYGGDTRKIALKMIAATGTSGDKAAIEAVSGMLENERDASIRQLGEKALDSLR